MPQRLDELLQECSVKITVPGGWGTGFFVAPGLILTCDHVGKALDADDRAQILRQQWSFTKTEKNSLTYLQWFKIHKMQNNYTNNTKPK